MYKSTRLLVEQLNQMQQKISGFEQMGSMVWDGASAHNSSPEGISIYDVSTWLMESHNGSKITNDSNKLMNDGNWKMIKKLMDGPPPQGPPTNTTAGH